MIIYISFYLKHRTLDMMSRKVYNNRDGDNMDNIYKNKIIRRMKSKDDNTIFISSDFADLTSLTSIRKILSRLVIEGKIVRINQGLFSVPKYNKILKKNIMPSAYNIAYAYARKLSWDIYPTPTTSLNLTGISTQVPSKYAFISDGPYKQYNYLNYIIEYKHSANRFLKGLSTTQIVIIQALKGITEDQITEEKLDKLAKYALDKKEMNILKNTKKLPEWIYRALVRIEGMNNTNG